MSLNDPTKPIDTIFSLLKSTKKMQLSGPAFAYP